MFLATSRPAIFGQAADGLLEHAFDERFGRLRDGGGHLNPRRSAVKKRPGVGPNRFDFRPAFLQPAGRLVREGRGLGHSDGQIAEAPVSPVRMRMTSASCDTKILPSPIFPVRAALTIVSTAV